VRCGVPWAISGVCASGADRVVAAGRFGCAHHGDGIWVCFGGARGPAGARIATLVETPGSCAPEEAQRTGAAGDESGWCDRGGGRLVSAGGGRLRVFPKRPVVLE
jgi:hypothetical protein